MTTFKDNNIPSHITKGGPGDKFIGGGKVDTSKWFGNIKKIGILEEQIKNEDIWFCAAPFQMVYTNTRGEFRPCSWATEEASNGEYIDKVSMQEYFLNNPELNELRREMTDPNSDLKLSKQVCRACFKQEKDYGRSRRQFSMKIQSNDTHLWPRLHDTVERFIATDEVKFDQRLLEVQIKAFGNQCNLDCYMCQPFDSTTRLKSINSNELTDESIFSVGSKKKPLQMGKITLDSAVDQIAEIAPYIYNLKLIGGEPLVMKKFYNLLEQIIATGEAKNIMVKYQTNMSVLEFERIKISKLIPEFKLFEFTVSLDGIGKADEYIRRRSSWKDIVNNMKAVKKYPNVSININGTISFLSVLRFYELIEWFDDNKEMFDQINWSNIRGPKKLCANVLPEAIKKDLIEKYKNFPDIQNVLMEDNGGYDYQDTIDYLIMNDKYYKGTKWDMNVFDVFPELEEYHVPKEIIDYELIGSSNE